MTNKTTPAEMETSMESIALLINNLSRHAADIAHARRTLFNAYLAEGFTEPQALELCKSLALI